MHKNYISILILSITAIVIIGGFIASVSSFSKKETGTQSVQSEQTTNTQRLTGQLYEKVVYSPDHSTTTVPLLHISEPFPVPEEYSTEPIEYIELITPEAYDWKSLVGSHVNVEGVLGEAWGSETVAKFDTTIIEKAEDLPKDPVLAENSIVGMVSENAGVCGVGTKIVFFLPENKTIFIHSGSEPIDTHVGYGTWSLEGLSSGYQYPYKTEFGNSWSDGYAGPGFYSECASTLHSSADSLHDLSRKTINKYFSELSPEEQSEIREFYPTLRL